MPGYHPRRAWADKCFEDKNMHTTRNAIALMPEAHIQVTPGFIGVRGLLEKLT